VENFAPPLESNARLLDMNEIECARCGWNWIMFEGQTEDDCPFCPEFLGGITFQTSP
jgi:hypothetical protein